MGKYMSNISRIISNAIFRVNCCGLYMAIYGTYLAKRNYKLGKGDSIYLNTYLVKRKRDIIVVWS